MIFKNVVIYKFTKPWNVSQGELEALLADKHFVPVGEHEISRQGWVSALPGDDYRAFEVNDCVFIRLRKDEKVLKASAVNREVNDIVQVIERGQMRKVRKKEKDEIKDRVVAKHLPHALIESKYVSAYVDLRKQWMIVDAGTHKIAEDLTHFLRVTLESLPVRTFPVEISPTVVMTNTLHPDIGSWLYNSFTLGEECTMVDIEGAKAKFSDIDLMSDEVTRHITDAEMMVTSLRLSIDDRVAFTVTDDFRVKKIKFLDKFQEAVLDHEPEDEDLDAGLSYATANLFLMTGEFRDLLDRLIECMGGEEESFDPMEGLQ